MNVSKKSERTALGHLSLLLEGTVY